MKIVFLLSGRAAGTPGIQSSRGFAAAPGTIRARIKSRVERVLPSLSWHEVNMEVELAGDVKNGDEVSNRERLAPGRSQTC